jgi:hypothetical protein
MTKSGRIRWVGHMAYMGENRNALEILKENRHLETLDKDERIILNCIVKKYHERGWTNWYGSIMHL